MESKVSLLVHMSTTLIRSYTQLNRDPALILCSFRIYFTAVRSLEIRKREAKLWIMGEGVSFPYQSVFA
jgi:hypothetical protein